MTPCTGNKDEMIKAGANVGNNVKIVGDIHYSSEPYLITIGDNTTISFECALITHDAATRVNRNLPNGDKETSIFGTIDIGKNCFIGCRTTILSNVKIGDNTIIGACSLVCSDIPSNVVAAGIPCKVICTLDEYQEKHKNDFFYKDDLVYLNTLPVNKRKEFIANHYKL